MGRFIDGDRDEDDVDPEAPTRRAGGLPRRPAADGDDDWPDLTRGRRSGRRDEEEDEGAPRTTRFARRRRADSDALDDADEEGEERPLPCGWLVVVSGPGVGHAAVIENGVNILGRARSSQIPLDFGDRGISREDHVRVSYDEISREFHLIPGKGPITRLHGELLKEPKLLCRGDVISLGNTMLRFVPFCDDGFDWTEALAE